MSQLLADVLENAIQNVNNIQEKALKKIENSYGASVDNCQITLPPDHELWKTITEHPVCREHSLEHEILILQKELTNKVLTSYPDTIIHIFDPGIMRGITELLGSQIRVIRLSDRLFAVVDDADNITFNLAQTWQDNNGATVSSFKINEHTSVGVATKNIDDNRSYITILSIKEYDRVHNIIGAGYEYQKGRWITFNQIGKNKKIVRLLHEDAKFDATDFFATKFDSEIQKYIEVVFSDKICELTGINPDGLQFVREVKSYAKLLNSIGEMCRNKLPPITEILEATNLFIEQTDKKQSKSITVGKVTIRKEATENVWDKFNSISRYRFSSSNEAYIYYDNSLVGILEHMWGNRITLISAFPDNSIIVRHVYDHKDGSLRAVNVEKVATGCNVLFNKYSDGVDMLISGNSYSYHFVFDNNKKEWLYHFEKLSTKSVEDLKKSEKQLIDSMLDCLAKDNALAVIAEEETNNLSL